MLLIEYSTLELVSSWATPRTQEEKEHQSHKHQARPVGWRGCGGKIQDPTQGWNACAPFTSASQGQLRNGPGSTENSFLSSPASKRLVVRREWSLFIGYCLGLSGELEVGYPYSLYRIMCSVLLGLTYQRIPGHLESSSESIYHSQHP